MAHGKSIELRKIPRRTVGVLHEHRPHNTQRYKALGSFANRATRRAWAHGRGVPMPAATLVPYEPRRSHEAAVQAHLAEIQATVDAVPVF